MSKNKNGFTLVELVAVVVILVILLVIAVQITNKNLEKSKVNSFLAEANVFAKGALQKQSTDSEEDIVRDDSFHGGMYGKVCYSISRGKLNKYVSKTKNTYKGSVEVCYGPDCTYATKIWVTDGKHYIDGLTEASKESQIQKAFTTKYPETCGIRAIGGGTGGSLAVADFDYTGEEQEFNVLLDGIYSLEVWGAQGGDYSSISTGGYGAYSYVDVVLKKGDTLYVNVGGKGSPRCTGDVDCPGGYNGGAKGSTSVGAGGGATHIATKSGELRNVPIGYVYIIAGGGGGGTSSTGDLYSHNAGGYYSRAQSFTSDCRQYGVGSYGGFAPDNTTYAGRGGGYVSGTCGSGVYGGNGYVFNSNTRNGVMYCFDCPATWHASGCCNGTESVSYSTTKTTALAQFSDEPVATYSKAGNGFARITYLSSEVDNSLTEFYSYGASYKSFSSLSWGGSYVTMNADRISVDAQNSWVYTTDPVDLSLYNSVIIKLTNFNPEDYRVVFASNYNDSGGNSDDLLIPNWESLGNNSYVASLSDETRKNLKLSFQTLNKRVTYDIRYVAFSTKTADEIKANHSFIPNS